MSAVLLDEGPLEAATRSLLNCRQPALAIVSRRHRQSTARQRPFPFLMKEWSAAAGPRFATVLGIGPSRHDGPGGAVRAACSAIGLAARALLLASVIAFAVPTLAIAALPTTSSCWVLLRFSSRGSALGGRRCRNCCRARLRIRGLFRRRPFRGHADDCPAFHSAEHWPPCWRRVSVPAYGWRGLFRRRRRHADRGGGGSCSRLLPESASLSCRARRERLAGARPVCLQRLGHRVGAESTFVDAVGHRRAPRSRGSRFARLFCARPSSRTTLGPLPARFFFCLLAKLRSASSGLWRWLADRRFLPPAAGEQRAGGVQLRRCRPAPSGARLVIQALSGRGRDDGPACLGWRWRARLALAGDRRLPSRRWTVWLIGMFRLDGRAS